MLANLVLLARHQAIAAGATKKLYRAVERGDAATVQALLDKGADPNTCEHPAPPPANLWQRLGRRFFPRQAPAGEGQRVLNRAVFHRRADLVRLLLVRGARPIERDNDAYQRDALHMAAYQGAVDCAGLLLEHGAKLERRDRNGQTPLMLAATFDQTELVELLLNRGAQMEARDNGGWTALHYACIPRGHLALHALGLLVERGADVNAVTKKGETALTLMARVPEEEAEAALRLLLSRGADVQRGRSEGKTAVELAQELGDWRRVRLLKQASKRQ